MMKRIAFLWQNNRIALLAFVVVVAGLGVFGVRTVTSAIYWMDPAHQDQTLAEWMSPRYVARSYKLPPKVLGPALFLDKDAPPRRVSLGKIADENGMTMDELQARIDAAAEDWRASQ